MSLLKTNEIQNYNGSSLTLTASTVSTSAQLNTGGNISVTGSLNVSDDSTTRTNLGLGTIATQDSDSITVTGGTATLDALTVSGSDSGDLVRITQTGSGNALVVEDSTNPDSSPFVVDSSGNVAIGTNLPGAKLEIKTATDRRLTIASANVLASGIRIESVNDAGSANQGMQFNGNPFAWISNGTERMRIDSSGNVGIGTGSSISYQLQLSTDSAGKPSTNTWTIVSDERIKENIELADLDLCYDAVKNIPLKRFKWRDEVYSEEQVADRHKLGWIAQDVESVYPKAVNIHEFRYNQVYNETIIPAVEEELDEDGNVITEAQEERTEKELVSEDVIEDCRNLNADQIYAAMFGAIQKLIQKVETLETRIAELEA